MLAICMAGSRGVDDIVVWAEEAEEDADAECEGNGGDEGSEDGIGAELDDDSVST